MESFQVSDSDNPISLLRMCGLLGTPLELSAATLRVLGPYASISCIFSEIDRPTVLARSTNCVIPWVGDYFKDLLLSMIGTSSILQGFSGENLTVYDIRFLLTVIENQPSSILKCLTIGNIISEDPAVAPDLQEMFSDLGRLLCTTCSLREISMSISMGLPSSFRLHGTCKGFPVPGWISNPEASITLGIDTLEDGPRSTANYLTQALDFMPQLDRLILFTIGELEDDTVDLLAAAASRCTSLKNLCLYVPDPRACALLFRIFTREGANQSISSFRLNFCEEFDDTYINFLSQLKSLSHLVLDIDWIWVTSGFNTSLSTNQRQRLGELLCSSVSLEQVLLRVPVSNTRWPWVTSMEEMISINAAGGTKPNVELFLYTLLDEDIEKGTPFLLRPRMSSNDLAVRWLRKPPFDRPYHSSSSEADHSESSQASADAVGIGPGDTQSSSGREELTHRANVKRPNLELHMFAHPAEEASEVWATLVDTVGSKTAFVSGLHLQLAPAPWLNGASQSAHAERFLQALQSTTTLRRLTIERGGDEYWPGGWKRLFTILRHNTSITDLGLLNCQDLADNAFKDLMEVLHSNGTLETVRLDGSPWATDGKALLINEALKRNKELDSYFAVFRKAAMELNGAKAGRLFLLGSAFAGKTQLRHTLMRTVHGRWSRSTLPESMRTEGVEVEKLMETEQMHVTIWDLAGQWIFRILHDIFFPRANHISIFLFVFSPYNRESRSVKSSRNLEDSFRAEFEEWLRFIASNSQSTGRMLPKVLVAVSHLDKMKRRDLSWAQSTVQDLRQQFEGVLDICSGGQDVYPIDGRKRSGILPLRNSILRMFKESADCRSPPVPMACSRLSSLIAQQLADYQSPHVTMTCSSLSSLLPRKSTENLKEYRPICSQIEFHRFCYDHSELKPSTTTTDQEEVVRSMVSYLHDTGSIICLPSLERIVVDPNWLTHVFLGELIAIGQKLQTDKDKRKKKKLHLLEVVPSSSKSGFVSSTDFHSLLSSFLSEHSELKDIDATLLENILIHFDLCCKVDSEQGCTQYYIPAIVREDESLLPLGNSRDPLSWISATGSNVDHKYIGFRLQCASPRTMSLTAAFFPRFQIYMRQKLMKEMKLKDADVKCSRNLLHLCLDGHEIYIESSDLLKSHIDVMVRCSPHKTRETAVQYILGTVVDELRVFCASSKGCPGVVLVTAVIQTKCVEKLIPLEHRGRDHAVLVETLKEQLQSSIEDYLLESVQTLNSAESSSGDSVTSMLNYEHSWPAIPECILPRISEFARNLLPESEIQSVVEIVRQRQKKQLEQLEQIIDEMNQHDTESDEGASGESINMSEASGSGTSVPPISRQPSFVGLIIDKLKNIEETVDNRLVQLKTALERIESEVSKIIQLHHSVQSSLKSFMSKVDQAIGYAKSFEQARTPRRPFLRFENLDIFHRITATMRLGTPVRLQFLCESIGGPHIVLDQPGLELCLEKKNMEWLRSLNDISLTMIYYLVKAGLHVTLGLGQVVPELDNPTIGIPAAIGTTVMDDASLSGNVISVQRTGSISPEETWSRLRSLLAPMLEDNFTALFKLYKVKYLDLGDAGYAWVCKECMKNGQRFGTLECL